MSGLRSRRKGLAGEREVAAIFESAGWSMRGLEGSGDWLAFKDGALREAFGMIDNATLHVECKRAERLRLPEWLAQAANEAPTGVPYVVVFRQNRSEWFATSRLIDFLELVA